MKNRKKIWLAVALFAVIESFAFPEILFPDCIEEYTADKYPMCKREQKKEKSWRSKKTKKHITKVLQILQKYFKNISNYIDIFVKM